MIVTKKALPRRTFLRGLGAALALPVLDSMTPAMSAAVPQPARLAFLYHPVGMIMDRWTPVKTGANFEMPATMQPLAPFRENLNILTGLAQVQGRALGDGPGDHAREGATWLTGVHPKRSETNIGCGVSADQIAANALGKHTQLASLEISLEAPGLAGACDQNYSCAYTNTVSWKTPVTPLPMEVNPRIVFERLFGETGATDPATRRARLNNQRSILDYVAGSIDRLQTELGPRDRAKLSEYLDAIRDIERRIQKAEQNADVKLPDMAKPAAAPDAFEEHAQLMIDLQAIAYQTDLTRVVTFMFGRAGSNRSYRSIGISDGHHSITHHMNDPEKIDKVAQIDTHLVRTFAAYLQKMKSTPDGGGGTLLDNMMICYGSSLGDANIHTHHDLPIALVAGNRFCQGNRHLRYSSETPLNNLFLSMFAKAEIPCERFGDSTGLLSL
ncbi:MAG: DUF1552 domain-containing protein [Candidatus Solibacter usitatus]|nr:DUF1552 domain-containing protein [Candidatus Solibacter usitatus]